MNQFKGKKVTSLTYEFFGKVIRDEDKNR